MTRRNWVLSFPFSVWLLFATVTSAAADDRLVGVWTLDEGFQTVELLFRSDGRYQLDTKSTDADFDFTSTDRGVYTINGAQLSLTPYDFLGAPQTVQYEFQLAGSSLSLTRIDIPVSQTHQFKPGSREDVLARQNVDTILVGTWGREIEFFGKAEYTFRPDGHYFLKNTPEDPQFPAEFIRGRYTRVGTHLTLKPYSGIEAQYEIDFFGNTLTLIQQDGTSGHSNAYEAVSGSRDEVLAKSVAAEAFLSSINWQVGIWEIRDEVNVVDLMLRPDGHYTATNATANLRGMVRGRYLLELEPLRIKFSPFIGQGLYSRDNGDFGKVERTRELDYYDGELQLIDPESISQSVALGHKRPGSDLVVMEKVRQAQLERAREDWQIGIWEVNDPTGWMEFTYRPDNRYIVKSGADGVPSQVERGRYALAPVKITLAPYAGLGAARGFDVDLFDGELFLVGNLNRMVVARKIPGSETGVIEKTVNPEATKGERGSVLGLWTANLPGQYGELVFRPDGQFRSSRCSNNALSQDYGLYSVNMGTRTLVYDSRFSPVQTQGLDFYGNTLTIFGGLGPPRTYTVNLGTVDAAIIASFAGDSAETQIDAQWMERVPIAARDPNSVQIPVGDIPADPNSGHVFNTSTVLKNYQLYRRLIPGLVYFNDQGTIKSVEVVNTREWHFFPNGRVFIRFRNYHAGAVYPTTVLEVTGSWGAYRVESRPVQTDILHLYADNSLFIQTDLGEQIEMTLEDGRRNLFWGKDYQILSEWSAEQKPIPCQGPGTSDPSLLNTGVALSTQIQPDPVGDASPVRINLTGPVSGNFTLSGTAEAAASLVTERTTSLVPPIVWQSLQTNTVASGSFSLSVPQGTNSEVYFRLRQQ